MELTTLGESGLRVPRIAFGCSKFGQRTSEADAVDLARRAIEMGITFFDTADVYADGESERILGKAVSGKRDQCVIATKFRHRAESLGGSRKSIRVAVDGSLSRLNTEYIDLYQMHAPDPTTPIEETVRALQDLVKAGKILYFGLCNVKAWQAVDAQRVAWSLAGAPIVSLQVPINAVTLDAYRDLKPIARSFKLGLLAATPLARGLLGGVYGAECPPPPGHPLLSHKGVGYWNEAGRAVASRLRSVARERNRSPAQLALELLLSFTEIASLLVGPTTIQQLADCGGVTSCPLDAPTIRYLLHGTGSEPESSTHLENRR